MKRLLSIVLCVLLVCGVFPVIPVHADNVLEIFNGTAQITEKLHLQEYKSLELSALTPSKDASGVVTGTPIDLADGKYITWHSNLPLLADVDDKGVVTAYDFSKRAIIQLWIDENIRVLPLVGDSMAEAIWQKIDSSGIDVDNTDTNVIVGIVSAIAGEALGESLRKALDSMNVEITATLYSKEGKALGSDKVEFVVDKNLIGSISPTGVHITNRKTVPTTVAVGATVQLYGACTPVRLKQGIKWTVGKTIFDTESSKHATVSKDGLVTFTSPGTATIRVNPSSDIHAAYTSSITFTVLDPKDLPVKSFKVVGPTEVQEGTTIQLAATDFDPKGCYKGDLTWKSSNPAVAVVDQSGIVTGLDGGSGIQYSNPVTITATVGGVSVNYEIKVTRKVVSELSSIEIVGNSTLGVGEAFTYESTIYPTRLNTSSSISREWGYIDVTTGEKVPAKVGSEAKNDIISIRDDGTVTALSAGVVTIYCTAQQKDKVVTDTLEIICGKAITDFTINGNLTIKEGDTTTLTIGNIVPADFEPALLKTIKWTIDDISTATVNQNGVVLGRDSGGNYSSKTANITATVSGISKTVAVTVKDRIGSEKYSDAEILGNDTVIVDIPRPFSFATYPQRIKRTGIFWGVNTVDGTAPWSASQRYNGQNRNTENDFSAISDTGVLTGKKSGTTKLYAYAKNSIFTYIEKSRDINIVEIIPDAIMLKAPTKTEYLEGDTQIDTQGLEVSLKYNIDSVREFYPDADSLTQEQLMPTVTDYTISKLNPDIIDTEQYIIVSVTRAGKVLNAVFPVTIKSKEVSSLKITPPQKLEYLEGDKFSQEGLKATVSYTNAPDEEVIPQIDYSSFNMEAYDVPQNVRVFYEHAGRTVEAFFSITVYGIPKVSVKVTGVVDNWTSEPITVKLSSTHPLEGVTYYWQNFNSGNWVKMDGDTLVIDKPINKPFHFKAVNSKNLESPKTDDIHLMFDNVTPSFTLRQEKTDFSKNDYRIFIDNLKKGISGIRKVTVNGAIIESTKEFTVKENGAYEVTVTTNNGLSHTEKIVIRNIDKYVPTILGVTMEQVESDLPQNKYEGDELNYYSGTVKLTAEANDLGTSGIDNIQYRRVDENRQPLENFINYDSIEGVIYNTNFKGYIEFRAVDKAGNISASKFSDGFVLDRNKPVIASLNPTCGDKTYTSDTWAADIVTLTPKSSAFSGIYECLYKVNNGPWQVLEGDSVKILDDGIFTYTFKVKSRSGLESDEYPITVKIDRTVPLVRVQSDSIFGTWTSDDVKFNLSTLNECPSGCTFYYSNGESWVKIDGNVAVLSNSTNSYYRFKAVNGAGLESAPSDAFKVMIDKAEPTAEVIYSVTEKTDAPYDLVIVPHSGESGIRKVYFDSKDITKDLKFTVSENGTHVITVIGNNLLSSSKTIEVTNFSPFTDATFTYEKIDENNIRITGFKSSAGNITIPMVIDNFDVKEIGASAFENAKIRSVSIPNTVTKISASAFANCSNLENITIPDSVKEIDKAAFSGSAKVTVYCYDNSPALAFCKENNLPYILLDLKTVGKTLINEDAGIIFTMQKNKNITEDIVTVKDGFNIVGVPSYIASNVNFYGTGSLIYVFKDGSLFKTYNLVVYGDLNGDSSVDILDASQVQNEFSQGTTLTGNTLLAADLTHDGAVASDDYQQITNLIISGK